MVGTFGLFSLCCFHVLDETSSLIEIQREDNGATLDIWKKGEAMRERELSHSHECELQQACLLSPHFTVTQVTGHSKEGQSNQDCSGQGQ